MNAEELQDVLDYMPSYNRIIKRVSEGLHEYHVSITELELAKQLAKRYKMDVMFISKHAIDELRNYQLEAIMSEYEIGGICKWLAGKIIIDDKLHLIAILEDVIESRNTAINLMRQYFPSEYDLCNAMLDVVSDVYQGFSIWHSHPTDSFISCGDIKNKTYAELNNTLDLWNLFRYRLWTEMSTDEVQYIYKMYEYLLDIMIMGGVSHEAVLFNSYIVSGDAVIVLYNNPEYKYVGALRNLYDYLLRYSQGYKVVESEGMLELYYRLYRYYYENCYTASRFTGFSVIEQFRRRINEEEIIGYRFTRL